jgi:hypothetical protein
MIKEIEVFITNHYYELLTISKKYTKNDDWASELLHEVLLQLFEKKQLNCNLDDKSIKYYIVRMLTINWCMPNSPFYIKYKKNIITHVDLTEAIQMTIQQTETESHKFMDILEQEFAEVNWFNKLIFEKYLTLGSLKKVSINTSITLPSIGRYVKETKQVLKFNTFKRYDNE